MAFGSVVVNTVMPDFHKPFWQDVHGEPPQELNAIEGNRFFDSPVTVIFGYESDFTPGNVQDTVICYCNPVSILPQVFYYMFGACQRGLAMYYPPGFVRLLYLVVE